eukprot:366105-Chlamydomonas_euryale.AAC.3
MVGDGWWCRLARSAVLESYLLRCSTAQGTVRCCRPYAVCHRLRGPAEAALHSKRAWDTVPVRSPAPALCPCRGLPMPWSAIALCQCSGLPVPWPTPARCPCRGLPVPRALMPPLPACPAVLLQTFDIRGGTYTAYRSYLATQRCGGTDSRAPHGTPDGGATPAGPSSTAAAAATQHSSRPPEYAFGGVKASALGPRFPGLCA